MRLHEDSDDDGDANADLAIVEMPAKKAPRQLVVLDSAESACSLERLIFKRPAAGSRNSCYNNFKSYQAIVKFKFMYAYNFVIGERASQHISQTYKSK